MLRFLDSTEAETASYDDMQNEPNVRPFGGAGRGILESEFQGQYQ